MPIREEFLETVLGSPPTGWEMGHVTLALFRPDERVPVEAWRRGAFAVHQLVHGARLTHAPTGRQIWTAPTMDMAAELAERIEPLTDWAAIADEMPAGSDLYPKVRAVIDQLDADEERINQ